MVHQLIKPQHEQVLPGSCLEIGLILRSQWYLAFWFSTDDHVARSMLTHVTMEDVALVDMLRLDQSISLTRMKDEGTEHRVEAVERPKWKLVNKKMGKLAEDRTTKSQIEIHFLSGRGGRYSSIRHFLCQHDLPLSQVVFVDEVPRVVPWRLLQAGRRYQVVLTPKNMLDAWYHEPYDESACLCCGDLLEADRRSAVPCQECDLQEVCNACSVQVREDWCTFMWAHEHWARAAIGSRVCMLCLSDLPASLSPAEDEHHVLFWRMRIVLFRFRD